MIGRITEASEAKTTLGFILETMFGRGLCRRGEDTGKAVQTGLRTVFKGVEERPKEESCKGRGRSGKVIKNGEILEGIKTSAWKKGRSTR